jgi:hypothetical protein
MDGSGPPTLAAKGFAALRLEGLQRGCKMIATELGSPKIICNGAGGRKKLTPAVKLGELKGKLGVES